MSDLDRSWRAGKPTIVGFLAGLPCGLVVLGFGGRLVMSIIALVLGARVEWDLAGTLQVVILGAALGPPAGVLYAAVEARLPGTWFVRGTLFGTGCCAALTAVYFLRPAGPVELETAPVVGSILFGALVIVFGPVLAATVSVIGRRLETSRTPHPALGIAVILAAFGCLALALFALISR
jgi:hypothetical protein